MLCAQLASHHFNLLAVTMASGLLTIADSNYDASDRTGKRCMAVDAGQLKALSPYEWKCSDMNNYNFATGRQGRRTDRSLEIYHLFICFLPSLNVN